MVILERGIHEMYPFLKDYDYEEDLIKNRKKICNTATKNITAIKWHYSFKCPQLIPELLPLLENPYIREYHKFVVSATIDRFSSTKFDDIVKVLNKKTKKW